MAQMPQQQMNRSTPIQLMQQQTQNVSTAQVNSPAAIAAAAAADSARKQRHIASMGTTSGPVMAVANPAVAAQQMDQMGKIQNKAM